MNRVAWAGVAFLLTIASMAYPAYATTYLGPSFQVTSTSPGGNVFLTVSTVSSSTFVAPPAGSGAACQSGQTCSFPLQSCPSTGQFYYSIHQITMTDAQNNAYMLGSSVRSGMVWPAVLGGPSSGGVSTQTTAHSFADALNVTTGDSFQLTFGAGAGGFSFTSVLGNPPNNVSPAGPYYWWTVAGNTYGSNLRLDQNPSINPTTTAGTYEADIEGVVVCGQNVFFDQGVKIFFDAPHNFTVPQFSGPMLAMVAVSMLGLALMRRKGTTPGLS